MLLVVDVAVIVVVNVILLLLHKNIGISGMFSTEPVTEKLFSLTTCYTDHFTIGNSKVILER